MNKQKEDRGVTKNQRSSGIPSLMDRNKVSGRETEKTTARGVQGSLSAMNGITRCDVPHFHKGRRESVIARESSRKR